MGGDQGSVGCGLEELRFCTVFGLESRIDT